ncbi:structural maintenance of chromosomes 2-1 isoform A [Chlorella sorokiniana]|uniref:Structural maintenance of chromosomes protein n=2 Tax=Chlorella TaxID=3071 RepID=A0A2P6U5G6_CHLSO|nr:structural maintenance of chromosomes 2-1 isoform B [Chlorella sorokiniana]PRW61563.1 structural maintenance of chromosomes 2-1 isoform A [Chlorella sorokiniana]|eukprot:PRW61562.1 structural maintenance of chromosomes 2-1 isoform B [Chlorella sorokiniana]
MFIKEITIDGFKSYAQRQVVAGFDPQFNAITGLNGSGKSNILDSICFVLGIQNLQQVRANSLQELVYKQGQAGITKATVSIVFDNREKERGPVGYEALDEITVTRQLVIGGRSKYLINGKVAEPSRVQQLFHSVQLNVNNPHFLIMQGRITKVLNMKPPEILGLLEEAAGTKMYEDKKKKALHTLEKKQIKVDEINKVLIEDISPALDKLRREKVQYMEWKKATDSQEKLLRFCVAYRYVEAQKLQDNGEAEVRGVQDEMHNLDAQAAHLDLEIREKEDDIKGLQTEKELQSGGEVKELQAKVDELSKDLVKDTSSWNNKKEELAAEQANCEQLATSLAEVDEEGMRAKVKQASEERDAAQAALNSAELAVQAAQNELAGAEAGDGRDASNRSLQERLADAQNAQTEAEAEAKAADTRCKHLTKQLAEQRKALASKQKEGSKLLKDLEKERAAVQQCQAAAAGLGYDPAAAAGLEEEAERQRGEVRRWKDRCDELSSQLAAIDFRYSDPERGFDRSRVKGVVAKLTRVADPSTATALEVAAGGKLYQVVVDSEQTAKALLANGQLRQRVTIIPLNKVSARDIEPQRLAAARRLAGDKAQPALELVGYDQELSAAMKYVFGGSFICKDAGTAKKLAFAREVSTRCITLEGDDFNPGGTLTGGSRNKGNSVLARLHELAQTEEGLAAAQAAFDQAQASLQAMAAAAQQYKKLSQELELKQHSLKLLEERMQGSEAHQLSEAVAASERELGEAQAAVAAAQQKKAEMVAAAKALQHEIANFGKERDKRIKAAKDKIAAAKKEAEAAKKALKAKQTAMQAVLAEAEAADGERKTLGEQLTAAKMAAKDLEKQVAELASVVAKIKAEYDDHEARLKERLDRLKECDAEIAAATKERDALEGRKTDLVVEKKKLGNKLDTLRKGMQESAEKIRKLEREYQWIASEKQFFGRPGSDYDFEGNNVDEKFEEYNTANATIEGLSKKVNKKVMQMFEKAEQEYNELKRKKDVVEADKSRIQQTIGALDEKKREALEKTWRKVDGDFGSIFGTLLPGTTAKLEPQEGRSFMEGLEVKVAFGGVWKDSLSELSGGQKSLLALSLILAMLLFKPAPIYILDEVDAALDLSHTQNIGRMIKQHFPQSQFIVVSLKEGMFNNANVIFRTKFVDGVSTVTRTVNTGAAAAAGGGQAGGSKTAAGRGRAALRENVRG